jgi:repressor LexA
MQDLSFLQQTIYYFIQDEILDRGRPPTNREIGAALGIKSTGNVEYHLAYLEKKGYIKREERVSRGIRLPPRALEIRGRIAAGQPLEIFDEPELLLDLPGQASGGSSYLLQVSGTALLEEQIVEGDYVLVDPEAQIASGDLVVAYERGDAASERGAAMLKRFYREQHRIELRPANAALASRSIAAEEWERDWAIAGKVKAIYRFFDQP